LSFELIDTDYNDQDSDIYFAININITRLLYRHIKWDRTGSCEQGLRVKQPPW